MMEEGRGKMEEVWSYNTKKEFCEELSECTIFEPIRGLEPLTHALRMRCSTN